MMDVKSRIPVHKRQLVAMYIAEYLRVCRFQEDQGTPKRTVDVLSRILEGIISNQQIRVLSYVQLRTEVRTADVMTFLDTSEQHASTLLKQLFDLCLLDRREDDTSQGFVYYPFAIKNLV